MASLFVQNGMTTAVFRATSHATFAGGTLNSGGATNSNHLRNAGAWMETTGGITNRSATPTRQDAPLLINGGFALAPKLIATVGAVLQDTNAYQWWTTNADFTVLFGGTPMDGARGQFDIKNTAATDITVTWPISWSISQQALISSFRASSNGITEVFWYHEGGSNRIRVATKEIVENFNAPTAGQVVAFHDPNTKTNITVAGTGDVTASVSFAVDNVAIRSDGTGKGVQRSGITIDDSDNVRGHSFFATNFMSATGFTNAGAYVGTIDGSVAGTTLKFKNYLYLKGPDLVQNGAMLPNTNDVTAVTFGKVLFSNSADQTANYADWHIQVPDDIDTAVEPRAKIKFRLSGADTGTHRYVVSMASVADSAAYAGTPGTAINLDFAGDASGASADVETVGFTTLTGWAAAVTAGRHWVIRVARDGNDASDGSTVDSNLSLVVIEYGVTQ